MPKAIKSFKDLLVRAFASIALIVFATLAILNCFIMSGPGAGIDVITYAIKSAFLPTIAFGFLGYSLGSVLDRKPRKRPKKIKFVATQAQGDSSEKMESVFARDESDEAEAEAGTGGDEADES